VILHEAAPADAMSAVRRIMRLCRRIDADPAAGPAAALTELCALARPVLAADRVSVWVGRTGTAVPDPVAAAPGPLPEPDDADRADAAAPAPLDAPFASGGATPDGFVRAETARPRTWDEAACQFLATVAEAAATILAGHPRTRTAAAGDDRADLLDSILGGMPRALFWTDREHRLLGCNARFASIAGVDDPAALVGRTLDDLWPPEQAAQWRRVAGLVMARDQAIPDREEVHRLPDGAERTLLVSRAPLRDAAGRVCGLVGTVHDITTQKQAERERQESEATARRTAAALEDRLRFERTLLDTIPNPIFYKDETGRYLGCNRAFEAVVRQPAEALIGRTVADIAPPDLAAVYRDADAALLRDGGIQAYEAAVRSADGRLLDVMFNKAVVATADGKPAGIVGVMVDMTARKADERALAESERRFRDVADAAGEYIWEVDHDGRYTFLTERVSAVLGYPVEELLGRRPFDFMVPEDQDRVLDGFAESLRCGRPFAGLEHRSIRKDGRIVWQRINGVPMLGPTGTIVGYRGAGMDITESKRVRQSLIDRESKLREAERIARLGWWELSPGGRTIAWSPVLDEIWGRAPGDGPIGLDALMASVHPDDRDGVRAVLDGSADAAQVEFRILPPDGTRRYIFSDCRVDRDAEGCPVRIHGTAQDVTERRLAEKKVEESERRYRLLADNATDLISLHAADGTYLYVSPSCERLLGYRPDDLVGRTAYGLFHADDLARIRDPWEAAAAGGDGGIVTVTIRMRHKTGRWVWFETTSTRVEQGEPGRPPTIVSVSRDVGERVRYEMDLEDERRRIEDQAAYLAEAAESLAGARHDAEQARIAAEGANRAKSQFLATMSHELRTPLNAVLGFSEIIKDRAFGPGAIDKYVEYAADIHTSGRHLLDLINDILDISKIEAGKLELKPSVLEAEAVLESCRRLVAVRAADGDVRLELAVPDPMLPVYADERAVKQIVFNLLSNAIKFTPKGGRVRLSATAEGNATRICVSDTGIGIPNDQIDRVLQPFEQIDNQYNRAGGGTGLGLSLVKALVELHGGTLRVDSAVHRGTTVSVLFPLPPGEAGRPAAVPEPVRDALRRAC